MNGALLKPARRRAISVLPTPVGPIMRMFLGATSWRIASGSCCRRQRLRTATATARLASRWPMMKRSSSATICFGVRVSIGGRFYDARRLPLLRRDLLRRAGDEIESVAVAELLARHVDDLLHVPAEVRDDVEEGAGDGDVEALDSARP